MYSQGEQEFTPQHSEPWREPYHFYGSVWKTPPCWTMCDLVQRGALSPACAGLLATVAEASVSLAVVSPGSGAGKSTLLRALLASAAKDREVVYLRGWHDPFAFLERQSIRQGQRLLIANELSPHLNTYVWGDTARRAFEVIQHPTYGLWATAHATNRDELRSLLTQFFQAGRDHDFAWDPVVVSLTPTPGHDCHGWSKVTIDLGGNSVRFRLGNSLECGGECAVGAGPQHLCHAVNSEDDGHMIDGLGGCSGPERDFA